MFTLLQSSWKTESRKSRRQEPYQYVNLPAKRKMKAIMTKSENKPLAAILRYQPFSLFGCSVGDIVYLTLLIRFAT
jgi:hypothetical protein